MGVRQTANFVHSVREFFPDFDYLFHLDCDEFFILRGGITNIRAALEKSPVFSREKHLGLPSVLMDHRGNVKSVFDITKSKGELYGLRYADGHMWKVCFYVPTFRNEDRANYKRWELACIHGIDLPNRYSLHPSIGTLFHFSGWMHENVDESLKEIRKQYMALPTYETTEHISFYEYMIKKEEERARFEGRI